jgi:hypothetical protein
MKAGRCALCDAPIWRTAHDPSLAADILLWPMPDSVYLGVRHAGTDSRGRPTNSAIAVGIGSCFKCAPALGSPTSIIPNAIEVVEIEGAKARYAHWYTPGFGEWLRAHARDHLKMDGVAIGKLMAQWEADRA